MNETQFRQYRDLKKEIANLEKAILTKKSEFVHDYGIDYSTGFPIKIDISGVSEQDSKGRLIYILEQRKNKAEEICLKIEEEIDKIHDSRTRQVIRGLYIDGRTATSIGIELEQSEKNIRNIRDKYFGKVRKVRNCRGNIVSRKL